MLKVHCLIIFTFISSLFYTQTDNGYWNKQLKEQKEYRQSNIKRSIEIGNNIIKNCKDEHILAHSLYDISHLYTNQGDYIKGFESGMKAKNLLDPNKDNLSIVVYNNINLSNIYKRIGLIDRAKEELQSTRTIIDKVDPQNYLSKATINIATGSLLTSIQDNKNALPVYFEAEQLLLKANPSKQKNEKTRLLSSVYSDISNIYLQESNFEKAENYINKAIAVLGNTTSFDTQYINTVTLAEIYTKTGRNKESIQILTPLINDPRIEPIFMEFIYELLSISYKDINDVEQSKKFLAKADSMQATFGKQQVQGLKEAYKYVEKDLAEKESQKRKLNYIIIAIVAIFSATTLYGIIRYQKKLRNQKLAYQDLIKKLEEQKPVAAKKPKPKEDVEFNKTELELIEKLNNFEKEKGFLKKDLTLAVLAVELNTNSSYLSDIINKSKNKNINNYINELRINYITKELYENPALLNYKISYLADLAGFNSHNSFTLVFKKITKVSPSVFLDERRKELNKEKV